MGPPDVLFEETEALSCNRYTSQYLSLTSSIVRDQRPEANKLVHQVAGTHTFIHSYAVLTAILRVCLSYPAVPKSFDRKKLYGLREGYIIAGRVPLLQTLEPTVSK